MPIKDLVKIMFRAYFVITTGAVASMYVCCLLFNPNGNFTPVDIGGLLLVSLVSDASLLIFYSRKEQSKRNMLLRFFFHVPLTVGILLLFAHAFHWVNMKSIPQLVVFILLVLGVYAAVVAVAFYHDRKTAEKLNDGLRRRYHSE